MPRWSLLLRLASFLQCLKECVVDRVTKFADGRVVLGNIGGKPFYKASAGRGNGSDSSPSEVIGNGLFGNGTRAIVDAVYEVLFVVVKFDECFVKDFVQYPFCTRLIRWKVSDRVDLRDDPFGPRHIVEITKQVPDLVRLSVNDS